MVKVRRSINGEGQEVNHWERSGVQLLVKVRRSVTSEGQEVNQW